MFPQYFQPETGLKRLPDAQYRLLPTIVAMTTRHPKWCAVKNFPTETALLFSDFTLTVSFLYYNEMHY